MRKSSEQRLKETLEQIDFSPNEQQRRLKARFWTVYESNEVKGTLGCEFVLKLTGDHRIDAWWYLPGFKGWFLNEKEHQERLEYIYHLSLDALEEIILNPDPKCSGARVTAIKLVADLGNKLPKTAKDAFLDSKVHEMSKAQLQDFITKNARLLGLTVLDNAVNVLTAEAQEDEIEDSGRNETEDSH